MQFDTPMSTPGRPVPEPTPDSLPYWRGLNEGQLLFQRCRACGLVRHYPRPMCSACNSMEVDWIRASGKGRVHSWTVAHHAFHPAFKSALPYVLITADMDEGVRLCAPLRAPENTALKLGMALEVRLERVSDTLVLPALVLTGTAGHDDRSR